MSWIETLKNSDIVWAILAVCTCLSVPAIIFAVYTWIKGKRKKEFTYAKMTFQLVSGGVSSIDRLKLLFDETPIPDLSVTKFAIWNSGTEAIKREDLYSNKPLCIINESENAQILDTQIIPESDEKQKFELSMNEEKNVEVDFECAEKKDGVVIQIIHSGNADGLKPTIGIMGGEEFRSYQSKHKCRSNKWKNEQSVLLYVLFCCALALMFIISFSLYDLYKQSLSKYYNDLFFQEREVQDVYNSIISLENAFEYAKSAYEDEIEQLESSDATKQDEYQAVLDRRQAIFEALERRLQQAQDRSDSIDARIKQKEKELYAEKNRSTLFLIMFYLSILSYPALLFTFISEIRVINYLYIPPKLRKYVKVEITS